MKDSGEVNISTASLSTVNHSQQSTPKQKCTPCWSILLVGPAFLLVVSGRVVVVIEKVITGAGMEHCCTIEGVPFNYLGMFVLFCGVVAVLLIALAFQIHDLLLRRDFERKYGVKVSASTRTAPNYGGSDYSPTLHGYDHHDGD